MGTTNLLRSDAAAAFKAAVKAVQPASLLKGAIETRGDEVYVHSRLVPQVRGRHVVFSLGKAAPNFAEAWLRALPRWTNRAFVLTPHGTPVSPKLEAVAKILRGAHPFPDEHGEAATRKLLAVASKLGRDDLLIVLLSGGTSALSAVPIEGLSLEDVAATTKSLIRSGAPIQAINTVRRELLVAAGGGLARTASPAAVFTLVISDVIGDPLPSIGSGPTVPSPTTSADALAVLEQYGIIPQLPAAVVETLRTRSAGAEDASWQERTQTIVLGNNRTAVDAASAYLGKRDYHVVRMPQPLSGEAAALGRWLGSLAGSMRPTQPTAVLFGGETTVAVRGTGKGGRNQELALAAALQLHGLGHDAVVLAGGTDGIDGMSENAGGVVDTSTCTRLWDVGFDPQVALANNDSATALEAVGDAMVTGPTGTNVCDLTMVAVGPR